MGIGQKEPQTAALFQKQFGQPQRDSHRQIFDTESPMCCGNELVLVPSPCTIPVWEWLERSVASVDAVNRQLQVGTFLWLA